jgi:hypothetical protein
MILSDLTEAHAAAAPWSAVALPKLPVEEPTADIVEEADQVSRYWTSPSAGEWLIGSEVHKRAFCRMFRETFNPYRPSVIAWPRLDPEELRRLTSLPIWDIAVQTEGRARLRFAAYAASVPDPEMREAIMLNAWEENRHKEVLSGLVAAYGIALGPEPPYVQSRHPEWTYLVTGYSECVDSFFAFGLFELARRSGYFPVDLVGTFEPVIQEECRHILLFANWLAWHRANLPWWRRIVFEGRVATAWMFIAWERLGVARGLNKGNGADRQHANFTASSAKAVSSVEIDALDLMALCLQENDRRFAGYDRRLVRPTTVPALARLALRLASPWPGKKRRRR